MTMLHMEGTCGVLSTASEPITAVDLGEARECDLQIEVPVRFVHGPTLQLPGRHDIEAGPGDFALFRKVQAGVRCVWFARADGRSVAEAQRAPAGEADQQLMQRIGQLEARLDQVIAMLRLHERDIAEGRTMLEHHTHETIRGRAA